VNKIPTLFVRDPQDMSRVTREVTSGCEWVLDGVGWATRKYDGTNVRVTVRDGAFVKLEKRRNPTREEKAAGAEPGYVDAEPSGPDDKHIFAAVNATDFTGWPDGSWPCEALGPKIQGGAEGVEPMLVQFSLPGWAMESAIPDGGPRTFDELKGVLSETDWEGIVWHHPDGRMAKLKCRDFGAKRQSQRKAEATR
jgi:hypothetical protein